MNVVAFDYLNRVHGLPTLKYGLWCGAVLKMLKAFEKVSGRIIPYKFGPRRSGIAKCWADTTLTQQLLNWKANRGLEQIFSDAWRCQQCSAALGNLLSDNG